MTYTAPSGQKYEWNKPTPPTPEDIAALVEHDKTAAPKPAGKPFVPELVGSGAQGAQAQARNLQGELGLADPVQAVGAPRSLYQASEALNTRVAASFAPTPEDKKALYEKIYGPDSFLPIGKDNALIRGYDDKGKRVWRIENPQGLDAGDVAGLVSAAPQLVAGIAAASAATPGPQEGMALLAKLSGLSAIASNSVGAIQDVGFRALSGQPINPAEIAQRRGLQAAGEFAAGVVLPAGIGLLRKGPEAKAAADVVGKFITEGKEAGKALMARGVKAATSIDVPEAVRNLFQTASTPAQAAGSIASVLSDLDQKISSTARNQLGRATDQINAQALVRPAEVLAPEVAGNLAQTNAVEVTKAAQEATDKLRSDALAKIADDVAKRPIHVADELGVIAPDKAAFVTLKNSQGLINQIKAGMLKDADGQPAQIYAPLLKTLSQIEQTTSIPQQLDAVRNVRTMVGNMTGQPGELFPGIQKGTAKALYGALSKDIEDSVAKVSPEGAKQLSAYNSAYARLVNDSEKSTFASKIIKSPQDGGFTSPEDAISLLAQGGSADWASAKDLLHPTVFDSVKKSVLGQWMGAATQQIGDKEVVNVPKLFSAVQGLQPSVRNAVVDPTEYKLLSSLNTQVNFLNGNKGLFSRTILPSSADIAEARSVAQAQGIDEANRNIKQALASTAERRNNMSNSVVSQVANGRLSVAIEDPARFFDSLVLSGKYNSAYVRRVFAKLPPSEQENVANVAFQRVFDQSRDAARSTVDMLSGKANGSYDQNAIAGKVLGSPESQARFAAVVGPDRMATLQNLVKYETGLAVEQASKGTGADRMVRLISRLPYHNLFATSVAAEALKTAAGRGLMASSGPKAIKAFSDARRVILNPASTQAEIQAAQGITRLAGADNYQKMMQQFTPEQQNAIDDYLLGADGQK